MAIKPFGDIVHTQNESNYIVTEEFINSGDAKNPITKSHSIVMVAKAFTKTTKLILLDSLLQEVVATLLHLVFQKPSTAKMCELPLELGPRYAA
jgi:predicted amino acid racemase